jgi:hypothetical protein
MYLHRVRLKDNVECKENATKYVAACNIRYSVLSGRLRRRRHQPLRWHLDGGLPPLSKDSSSSASTKVICSNPGTSIVISNSAGTARLTATCTTELYDTTTTPPTLISTDTQTSYADVGVNIVAQKGNDQKDVVNAIVNGVTFTGICISTSACSAVSTTGEALSLTR